MAGETSQLQASHGQSAQLPLARAQSGPSGTVASVRAIHPRWVRVAHWLNAIAMAIMILSGWRIYNASPLFAFEFPDALTIGGWLGGAIQWHFAAMWVLAVNGIVYLVLGLASGRFRRTLWPIRMRAVISDLRAALAGRLAHEDLAVYNAVQRLLYAGIIVVGVLIVLSGLAIWKPVQFPHLVAAAGGFDAARYVHFACMAAIVAFIAVHVTMALLVPKSLRAMIFGK